MEGIFTTTDEELVSSDIVGEAWASIADLGMTRVVDGTLVKVLAWYDNEMGHRKLGSPLLKLPMPKVHFASDHAGFALKNALIEYVRTLGHEVEDMGAHELSPEDDYPDFIMPCAERVAGEPGSFGIILGKSGAGEAMCANRIKGARAVVYYGGSREIITLAREHNDANILSLGAGFMTEEDARQAVELFLTTPFSQSPRHMRRLAKF
jgi:ribose 5-phosphate isomerase B